MNAIIIIITTILIINVHTTPKATHKPNKIFYFEGVELLFCDWVRTAEEKLTIGIPPNEDPTAKELSKFALSCGLIDVEKVDRVPSTRTPVVPWRSLLVVIT